PPLRVWVYTLCGTTLLDDPQPYRSLVERSPDGILVVDAAHVVYANWSAARLMAAGAAANLVGKTPLDFFHPSDRSSIADRIARWRDGETVSSIEATLLRMDGSTIDVEVVAGRFDDREPSPLQIVLRDITERKRIESALRESEERLTLAFAGAQE